MEGSATSENAHIPNDSLAVGPGAGNPLGGIFADQQAVARASHVLTAGGSVSGQ